MSIIQVLNQVKEGEIVLPAIQRNFVWPEEKVSMLLDSVMRSYPIGIALMWETYDNIQYRRFLHEYRADTKHTFSDNTDGNRLKVVLDGQQRLQSLYIALYGQHEGQYLYFDVLSGEEADDFQEERFDFRFASVQEIEKTNKDAEKVRSTPSHTHVTNGKLQHFVKVQQIFTMGAKAQQLFRKSLEKSLNLTDDETLRIMVNLAKIDEVLAKDENILKTVTIDENQPPGSPERKSESDVLEIFVRINVQGTRLSRSDLIFSMMKLNWKESAEALPQFVETINKGNCLGLDTDFVIRCLFATCHFGTKFNVDLLRNKANAEKMKRNFSRCCDAIRSTIDVVQNDCGCSSSRALGGYNTLVPFVYYLFHCPKQQVPKSEVEHFRKSLYLFGFSMPFSRYADSRLWKFIRMELKPLAEKGDHSFPFKEAIDWAASWENFDEFGSSLLQKNPRLALHVVQGLSGAKSLLSANEPEMDHIFPRSELRKKYDELVVNHYANFWLLSKGKNQNKSKKHPAKYFEKVPDSELRRALIDRQLLKYPSYKKFIKSRGEKMLDRVKKKLGFCDDDFAFLREEE